MRRLSLISYSVLVRCRAMRDIKTLAFVCALFAACATTDGGGGDDGTNDPPPTGSPVCGDAVCAASEIGVCSQDCGSGNPTEVCGNSKCEGNEPTTCASDCTTSSAVCGNGQCESSESQATCPGDCTTGGGGGNCPADPTECFLCILDATLCSAGLDPTTCQTCILGGP